MARWSGAAVRELEEALSEAVRAAFRHGETQQSRVAYIARHLIGETQPACCRSERPLPEKQQLSSELAALSGLLKDALNAATHQTGDPKRLVADHLFRAAEDCSTLGGRSGEPPLANGANGMNGAAPTTPPLAVAPAAPGDERDPRAKRQRLVPREPSPEAPARGPEAVCLEALLARRVRAPDPERPREAPVPPAARRARRHPQDVSRAPAVVLASSDGENPGA